MKLDSLSPCLPKHRPRPDDYFLLHTSTRTRHADPPASPIPAAARLFASTAVLTLLAAIPLCVFFHTLSSLFIYLSLVLFALPVVSFWIVSWHRGRRIAVACVYMLFLLWTWRQMQEDLSATSVVSSSGSSGARTDRKVFIASNLHNNQHVLPYYLAALQQLVQQLGVYSTYVSIYESHSTDRTKPMLTALDHDLSNLGVQHRIRMDDAQTKVGLGQHRNGRIEFLAYVRNVALEPLQQLWDQGQRFTHVLWINDVFFKPHDLVALLETDGGRYDQVCAMDFIGNGFYDVWVTRDRRGRTARRAWPYFAAKQEQQALRKGEPFLVNSCWNGATAFDARWFVRSNTTSPQHPAPRDTLSTNDTQDVNANTREPALHLPLRFRTSPRCFSSECQLLSLDMHRAVSPRRPRIWINPRVAVAYERRTFWQYTWLERWWVTAPWRSVWRDGIGMWMTQWYAFWPDLCGKWLEGWAAGDAPLAAKPYALSPRVG
ncbi:uncharacterized protein SRS1_13001 [Sporisorium reilianum f. sp. reilianum]|uniref:Uncharacterized protein n=1 Tax=Sporisorium reilianum f. sp. reilianum TaxID=72559 RepID=A0A2N8UCT1_9BASI|nr:uncharacterized protein SRS1_13001 [Sporisorium reilianum f. sp. reilianum]